jgi:Mn2+/Fe2+ NRAMP family transporter
MKGWRMQTTPPTPPKGATPQPKGGDSSPAVELERIRYGAGLILAAFVFLLIVMVVAITQFDTAADVTAVVGAVTGVVGTIIGAFFGVQVGSSGRESAEAERIDAQKTALALAAKLDPKEAEAIIDMIR